MAFDQRLRYQFSAFFADGTNPSAATLGESIEALTRSVDGPAMGLTKFGNPENQALMTIGEGGARETAQTMWRAGGGVWRLTWGGFRLDLHFDARAYAEVREERARTVAEVGERIMPSFLSAVSKIRSECTRLALIVYATDSCGDELTRPAEIVSRRFLKDGAAEAGALSDLSVRINRPEIWNLRGRDISVNRIETAAATWVMRAAAAETTLSWQLDVNTTPLESPLTKDHISAFFDHGLRSTTAMLEEVTKEIET